MTTSSMTCLVGDSYNTYEPSLAFSPKRKGSSSNHQFSGVKMLVSGRIFSKNQWKKKLGKKLMAPKWLISFTKKQPHSLSFSPPPARTKNKEQPTNQPTNQTTGPFIQKQKRPLPPSNHPHIFNIHLLVETTHLCLQLFTLTGQGHLDQPKGGKVEDDFSYGKYTPKPTP